MLFKVKFGKKRLAKFYIFYKKDSTKYAKQQEKYYKKLLDSAYRARMKDVKVRKQLEKKGIHLPNVDASQEAILNQELKRWWALARDTTKSDSVKQLARNKVKELAIQRARQYPGFGHLMDRYQSSQDSLDWKSVSKQVPGLDTLSGLFDSDPDKLFAMAEDQVEQKLKSVPGMNSIQGQLAQAQKMQNIPDQYKKQYGQYTDSGHLKGQGKQKAAQEAADYFASHADKLQAAQQKVSKLLSKYRDFNNSNDLSSAVKRTSLRGKTFWERIVVGGNFNVVSTKPFALDLSPQFGYRFNTKFYLGIGAGYRYSYKDSIRHGWYVSPVNTSFKAFANYDLIKSFFSYAEWECAGIKTTKNDVNRKAWVNNYFVGIGKRFLIHPKLYMTLTALYNLNNQNENPTYTRRFQVRVGFQLSELATRKKKVYYDPNR